MQSAEILFYYFRDQNQMLFGIACRMPRPLRVICVVQTWGRQTDPLEVHAAGWLHTA